MKISLIVTTYNWQKALKLTLQSIACQSCLPDEVIVADDGSSDGTGEMIDDFDGKFPVPLIHSWQPDEGFRAARSRNLAIARSIGEYIILIDGDLILHKDFVQDHLDFVRCNSFVQGGRVLIREQKTALLLAGSPGEFSFLASGLANRKNCLRSRLLSLLFSRQHRKITGIRSCNFAFWKQDALAVNGFNEDFEGWGREDSEFAIRLINKGVWRRDLKFQAVSYHLYHRDQSRTRLPENDALLKQTIDQQLTWCPNGLSNHKMKEG
jgi:glycosyltransferase involved in cell wall biosynthesis